MKSGTDSYLATSNAFTSSLTLAEECIEQKNYRHAEVLLKNAIWVRTKKDELIVNKEPVEEVLLGKLYWEMGEKRESLIQLREANRLYRNRGLLYINGSEDTPMALNRYHCILLRYLAIAERDNGTMPPSRIYNELLIPAYNFYTVNELEDDPEFQILKELKNSLYARIQRAGYFGLF